VGGERTGFRMGRCKKRRIWEVEIIMKYQKKYQKDTSLNKVLKIKDITMILMIWKPRTDFIH
jgi:hypothetical protein